MIAGFLADITSEHQRVTHLAGDGANSCVTEVANKLFVFERRMDVLFTQGKIMSSEMVSTYTYHIIQFLNDPSVIFSSKHLVLFTKPIGKAALFEPLQRIRPIAKNIIACLNAALPSNAWQRKFNCFRLPWPDREDQKESMYNRLEQVCRRARIDAALAKNEFSILLPRATQNARNGDTIQQAWARASKEYAELQLARQLVNLLLACVHATSNVERSLKHLAAQRSPERMRLAGEKMEDVFLVDQHAPESVAVARISDGIVVATNPYPGRIIKLYKQHF